MLPKRSSQRVRSESERRFRGSALETAGNIVDSAFSVRPVNTVSPKLGVACGRSGFSVFTEGPTISGVLNGLAWNGKAGETIVAYGGSIDWAVSDPPVQMRNL